MVSLMGADSNALAAGGGRWAGDVDDVVEPWRPQAGELSIATCLLTAPSYQGRCAEVHSVRTLNLRRLSAALILVVMVALVPALPASATTTATFSFTGTAQQFAVPAGVTSVDVDVFGAEGGYSVGTPGKGAQVTATVPVTPGDVLQIMVGGQGSGNGGFNGGGDGGAGFGPASAGGGASDIRVGTCAVTNSCGLMARAVVAGGGGGVGSSFSGPAIGGDGGLVGSAGSDPGGLGIFGAGGDATSGGAAAGSGASGVLGQGGNGGDGADAGSPFGGSFDEGGGGGGGGYYGGGGGGGGDAAGLGDPSAGNGGGGSSFGPGSATFVPGVQVGPGSITISFAGPPASTPTSTSLTSDGPNPSTDGDVASFTATVTPVPTGGAIQFAVDGVPFGAPVPVDVSGQATSDPVVGLAVGSHSVDAIYSGDPGSLPSGAPTLPYVVDPLVVPSTTTTTSTAPSTTLPATTAVPTTVPSGAVPVPAVPATTAKPVSSRSGTSTAPKRSAPKPTTSTVNPGSADQSTTTQTSAPATTALAATTTTLTTTTTTAVVPAPDQFADVRFNVAIDNEIEGRTADVEGQGFLAKSAVSIVMYSRPIELGQTTTDDEGSFALTAVFPAGLESGAHRIEVSGRSGTDEPVTYTWYLELDEAARLSRIERLPLASPPDWYLPAELAFVSPGALPVYVVTEHAPAVVATMVSAFALLAVIGGVGGIGSVGSGGSDGIRMFGGNPMRSGGGSGGGLSLGVVGAAAAAGATANQAGATSAKKKKSLGSAANKQHLLMLEATARGDRSSTWRLRPLGSFVDRISADVPGRVSARSPLAARVMTDGIYLRTMFGSLWLLMPLIGIALGVAASMNVGGAAVPPALWLMLAIVVLGILDSSAGIIAGITFCLLAVLAGNVTSTDSVRGLIGINLVFFAVPLIASKARPLRREPSTTNEGHFDRVADVVVAALIGAWAAKKLVGALPGLTGFEVPIAERAGTVALVALAALVVRYLLETAAMWWYPLRLGVVSPESLPKPGERQRLAMLAVQTFLFAFMAFAFLGNVWELWVGTALFAVPQLIDMRKHKLPNAGWLVRLLPGGIVKTVVMMVIGTYFALLVQNRIDDPARFITLGFVILTIPGLVLTGLGLFGRDGSTWKQSWGTRFGGIAILVAGVLLVEGIVTLG